jgi:hypothetical protein
MKYKITYGLGGGFGGADPDGEIIFALSLENAEHEAYERAKEEYESYGGMHGLLTVESVMEEDEELTEDEAQEVVNDDMESWLDYSAEAIIE